MSYGTTLIKPSEKAKDYSIEEKMVSKNSYLEPQDRSVKVIHETWIEPLSEELRKEMVLEEITLAAMDTSHHACESADSAVAFVFADEVQVTQSQWIYGGRKKSSIEVRHYPVKNKKYKDYVRAQKRGGYSWGHED